MNAASIPATGDQPPALAAADLTLQMGALYLRSGASTGRVVKVMRDMLAAMGQPNASAIVTPEQLTIAGTADHVPYTVTRATPRIAWHITRVGELEQLADRVQQGAVDHEQLRAELQRIETLPSPYNRWMVIAAWACAGAFLSRLLNADWPGTAVAFVACAAGQYVRSAIGSRANPGLTTLATATVAAAVGALGLRLGISHTNVGTLTASVALLVPGLWLITGALDIISGRQIRFGLYRVTVALLLFFTIVMGIFVALAIIT